MTITRKLSCLIIILLTSHTLLLSQAVPVWWYGGEIGANFNFYSSTINSPNGTFVQNPAFTKGNGSGLSLAPMIEYRPNPTWGGKLLLGFDGRGGSFDDAGSSKLSTSINYITLEPSLRWSPFDFGLHFFAGPRIGFNVAKSFTYTDPSGVKTDGEWSGTRGAALGGQLGVGYEFSLTPAGSDVQVHLAPFVSTHFGTGPRSEESWSLASVRAGVELKFGGLQFGSTNANAGSSEFSVRAPRIIPNARTIKETFPMRNYVFFDEGSNAIPQRYVTLTKDQAASFKEEQLLHPEPKDLTGRSRRQMVTYHNILNIVGDRMRRSAGSQVTLSGASEQGAENGQVLAEAVKEYLVGTFGIDGARISVRGAAKPAIPSAQPGGTRELDLVRPEDRRVDITSSTLDLLEPVQIVSLEEDPLESDVIVNVPNAPDALSSWSVVVTDASGGTKRFGPYTSAQERIPGRTILGDLKEGTYTVALEGQSKSGGEVKNSQTIHLIKSDEPEEAPGYRFSILFEFDQSKTVATYERFLTGTVAPLIQDGNSVIIHGHTDIVGEESHNLKLSQDRAQETQAVIEKALAAAGKKRVRFDTYGFGEDVRRAPFDNRLPEERFYNRTVIIDIVPE